MPKPIAKYLHHERTRHGRWVWYVQIPGGPRVRIHGEFGTEKFRTEYIAAVKALKSGEQPPRAKNERPLPIVVNAPEVLAAIPPELFDAMCPTKVYFAKSGDRVKIGITKDVVGRVRKLKTAAPDLEIIHTLTGGEEVERFLHRAFSEWRVGGEWFQWAPVKRFLKGLPLPERKRPEGARDIVF
jgi:hypothetical protein